MRIWCLGNFALAQVSIAETMLEVGWVELPHVLLNGAFGPGVEEAPQTS